MKRLSIQEDECAFEMAPMIDMVFLLLIFFMCASTLPNLSRDDQVQLPVADESIVPKNKKHDAVVNIRENGDVFWGQELCTYEDLTEYVAEKAEEIEELKIYIRADKKVSHRAVRKAVDACAKAGILDIQFAAYQSE